MSEARVVEFGRTIRRLRRERGFSQEALAAAAEIDRSYMGHVERGNKNVTVRNVFRIADALGVSPATLFEDVGGPPSTSPARPRRRSHRRS